MEVLHLRCAGLDVHQKTIMACARIASANGVSHHVQVFGTTTRDLLALADWLASHGCTHVAMESTSAQWLKTTLVQAAWAAVRTKDSYLRAQVRRLKSRRGPKKAIIAVAASMLRAIYFMLQRGVTSRDLGGSSFDRRDMARIARRLLDRLRDLGIQVEVRPAA